MASGRSCAGSDGKFSVPRSPSAMQMMLNSCRHRANGEWGVSAMTIRDEGQDAPQSRLQAQIRLMLSGIPGVVDGLEGAAAHPGDWADQSDVNYHHRERTLLVRDADVDRVASVVSGAP